MWLLSLERVVLLRAAWATALAPQIRVRSGEHDAEMTKTCKGKMVLDRKCYAEVRDVLRGHQSTRVGPGNDEALATM